MMGAGDAPYGGPQSIGVAPRASLLGALRWCPGWCLLLILASAMPTDFSFYLGPIRLSPYRVVLLVAVVPCLVRLLTGRAGRLHCVDALILAHLLWSWIVIAHHHGFAAAAESGGIRVVELGGAYLVARSCVTNERTFRGVVAALLALIALITPLLIIESATGLHLIKSIASKIGGTGFYSTIEPRFGFDRAFGPFDHPILLGVFSASLLSLVRLDALPRLGQPAHRRWPQLAVLMATLTSLSSGPLAALSTQMVLLGWERMTRRIPARWLLFSSLLAMVYLTVELVSNRSAVRVLLHYLTFSSHTAYNRITIFNWGIQDVWRNPIFGIGFNVWTRPPWMHSTSMDNFWLVQAVTFGIPGFLTLAAALLLMLGSGWRALPPRMQALRRGWAISLVGVAVAACTVHLWNSLFVHFAFLLGLGGWFLNLHRSAPRQESETSASPYIHAAPHLYPLRS